MSHAGLPPERVSVRPGRPSRREHDDEPPGAVHALDPLELDVARRRRAGDEDDRPPVARDRLEAREELGHRLDDLVAPATTHTCRSGTSVSALRPSPGPPVEGDRAGVRARDGARRERAVERVELSGQRGRRPRPASRRPVAGAGGGRAATPIVLAGEQARDVVGRRDARAVVRHPLDEARDDVLVRRARRSAGRRAERRRPARAPASAARTRPSTTSRAPLTAPPTTRGTSARGSTAASRLRPHPASGPTNQRTRPSRTAGRCSRRARRCARS